MPTLFVIVCVNHNSIFIVSLINCLPLCSYSKQRKYGSDADQKTPDRNTGFYETT